MMSRPLTMAAALAETFERFETSVRDDPAGALSEKGTKDKIFISNDGGNARRFNNFGYITHSLFMIHAEDVIYNRPGSEGSRAYLMSRLRTSAFGIGVIAVMTELAPLKKIQAKPEQDLTAKSAADTMRNSLDFIDTLINAGGLIGGIIAAEYIPLNASTAWPFDSTVVGKKLVRPDRLERFTLREQAGVEKMVPVGLAIPEPGEVTCPAHLFRHEPSGERFTHHLANIMVDYAEANILPAFIPEARQALAVPRTTSFS